MKNILSSPALILYTISGFLFFLSAIIKDEQLALIVKPMIAPSILFYYWQESKNKINFWYTTILILFFFSGILNLFDDGLALKYVIFTNTLAYGILLNFIIKSLLKIKFKSLENISLAHIVFTFLFLCTLLYVCLFLIFDFNFKLYGIIIIYSFELFLMGFLISIIYAVNCNKPNTYLMITIFCYIFCDLFYAIYYYYYDFILLRYLSILCNILSFYFLVNFFLNRNLNYNQENELL